MCDGCGEWDESTAEDRVGRENTVDLLKGLLDRGVSTATVIKAAMDSLAAAQRGHERAKLHHYDLREFIQRVLPESAYACSDCFGAAPSMNRPCPGCGGNRVISTAVLRNVLRDGTFADSKGG